MQVYKVKNNQNIFDVAMSLYGSIEGVFDLLINNDDLSFDSKLKAGDELVWDETFVINDSIVAKLKDMNLLPANGERHVYYKHTDAELKCIISIPSDRYGATLFISGDGDMIVDWGDNSNLETIHLTSTMNEYAHYFDNVTDSRQIRLYGDFNIKTWDISSVNGVILPVVPMIVDEVISRKNNIALHGLFLFKQTYSVVFNKLHVDNLLSLQDMNLAYLELKEIAYLDKYDFNDYLIYIAKNNNQRRNCKVVTDFQPSGTYKEPDKDEHGNYIINTGMEAIYVITHEVAWNESEAWEFDINGVIYKYENTDIA